MKRFSIAVVTLAAAGALLVVACGGRSAKRAGLPPEDSLYLPLPEDTVNKGTLSQSLCVSGTTAHQAIETWVNEHNDAIQSQIALIKLMMKVSARQLQKEGEFEYTVENGGRTLTLHALVQADDSIAYDATFNGPNITDYKFLDGTTAADKNSGAWTFHKQDGSDVVHVTWMRDGDDLTVERDRLDLGRHVSYTRVATAVTVVFTGPNHNATAHWDTETRDGDIQIESAIEICWEYDGTQYCDVACP